jgi:DNA invertase Pin-like site-specific DNA recombinase
MNMRAVIRAETLRCAVYTRKSSEEGLEQSFNSLHAQRDACEAYVRSQTGEGWLLSPKAYDDGGVSGGTMERPGLKLLLADIEAGKVDVVVVYKVDRLTRSLTDFARIVEAFDKAGVSFVSVTQAFNTTTSMGRLTLNVLLSFAQFEREVTGERIRDKIRLSKEKGMWMGSVPPLGYDAGDHTLIPNEAEAETVRSIFRRYLELGSVHALCTELNAEGVRSKAWTTLKGRSLGGVPFSRGALFHLLRNRHYRGEIVHKDRTYPGLHPAIVDAQLFEAVQRQRDQRQIKARRGSTKAATSLLTGRIFDGEGQRFSPTFSTGRSGRIHRYYVASEVQQGRGDADGGAVRRVGADALESLVLAELRRLSGREEGEPAQLLPMLLRLELRSEETHLVLDQAALFGCDHPELALEDLQGRLGPGERVVMEPGEPPSLRVALPRRMQLRGGRTWAVFSAAEAARPRVDQALVSALQRAHQLASMAGDLAPDGPYDRKLVRLAYLAPDLQRDILLGRQPAELTLAKLFRAELPLAWSAQRRLVARLAQER